MHLAALVVDVQLDVPPYGPFFDPYVLRQPPHGPPRVFVDPLLKVLHKVPVLLGLMIVQYPSQNNNKIIKIMIYNNLY